MRTALAAITSSITRAITRFAAARDGNVAITFALATLPVVGFVGAAIDYSHANSIRASLQTALDSTALMLSRDAASLSSTELQTKALSYFQALFTRSDVTNVTVSAAYTTGGGSNVVLNASVQMPTQFVSLIGYDKMTVSGSSTAKWGTSRLRVALVLDNTGSMAQYGKLNALKTATKNLLNQLQGASTVNGDVYVSIIPFVKDVNLGASNYTSDWIYWGTKTQDPNLSDNTSWDANNGTCSRGSAFTNRSDCVSYPICSKTKYRTQNQCQNNNGTWYTTAGTWTPDSHSTWNGCVVDRGYPASPSSLGGKSGPDTTYNFDTNAASPDRTKPSSLYAAEQYGSCPQAAMGLSYNWSAMNTLINNMAAAGNTNQAIGLQVGWMSLVGGGPFAVPPMDPNYKYQQIIILLTDGLNTQNRWSTNQSAIDARQQMTCDNFKKASKDNIIYTIQVNTDGDPTSTLLQNCASGPDKFYLLTNANAIISAFQQIGTSLTQLRVAK